MKGQVKRKKTARCEEFAAHTSCLSKQSFVLVRNARTHCVIASQHGQLHITLSTHKFTIGTLVRTVQTT
jgi:uncharacterized protein VirK/YbjX